MTKLAWCCAVFLSGCVSYNEVCRSDATPVIGRSARSIELRAQRLRTGEAPLGNLVADAMREATTVADAALVPAGYFSDKTACGTREFLDRGDIHQNDIDEMVPEDDTIAVVSLSGDELYSVLEHSVAALGGPGNTSESPAFAHVSNLFFSVECQGAAQRLSADGSQVTTLGGRVVPSSLVVDGEIVLSSSSVRLAVPTKLLLGKLGFVDLAAPGRLLLDTKVSLRAAVGSWIGRHSPIDPVVQGRITQRESCF